MAVSKVQAIINGQTYNLALNKSTGNYEAEITAPSKSSYPLSGHYYGITLKATDDAGNVTTKDASDSALGKSLQLKVKEKTAPVSTITYPTASAVITNNKPTIKWKVTDNDSGVNPDTISLIIDSGTKITGNSITKKAITGGYECSYTPAAALQDGNHTIKVDASDFDGNAAAQKSATFKLDTVPPSLSITSPPDNFITNKMSVTITGETNDLLSSPVAVTIKLNNGSAQTVSVNEEGIFTKTLTLIEGLNTITVTATDSAGKQSVVTRRVTVDIQPPVISKVSIIPNPVDAGKTFSIAATVVDT